MDEVTIWVLKMLSERRLSAQMASRILQALELLNKTEEAERNGQLAAVSLETPGSSEQQNENQNTIIEETPEIIESQDIIEIPKAQIPHIESKEDDGNNINERNELDTLDKEIIKSTNILVEQSKDSKGLIELPKSEKSSEDIMNEAGQENQPKTIEVFEVLKKTAIPNDNALLVIDEPVIALEKGADQEIQIFPKTKYDKNSLINVVDNTDIIFKKDSGNITIKNWDGDSVKFDGNKELLDIYQEGNHIKININGHEKFIFYVPSEVKGIKILSTLGPVNVEEYNYDMSINNDLGDIYVDSNKGELRAKTISGNMAIENCRGIISLSSESGSIVVSGVSSKKSENLDETGDSGKNLNDMLEYIPQPGQNKPENFAEVNIQNNTGDIALDNILGNINVKSNGEIIRLKRCRCQDIFIESKDGSINLKDVANSINLKCENGIIITEDFFGKIKINGKDTDISLMKSGDAQIYIESDNGNIEIKDCYADAYINSGTGDVNISGGSLSFAAMGRVDLKMKKGNAYLSRRTFEDIKVSVENGNANVSMEKLNSGGSGNINVYKGNITLQVSPDFKSDFTAQAPRKRIHLDLPIEIQDKDKNSLKGTLNSGGAKISLVAPEGDIFLQPIE